MILNVLVDHLISISLRVLHKIPARVIFTLSIMFILFMGYIDFITGHELVFSIFYLIPVTIIAWFNGKNSAFFASLLCGITGFYVFICSGEEYESILYPVWDCVVLVLMFIIISALIARMKNQMNIITSITRTDPLTGCYNRKYFYETVNRELEKSKRNGTTVGLAYIDLDNFKTINDTMGHKAGDFLLVKTAESVNHVIRTVDSLFRLGGDEFAILINNPVPSELSSMFARIEDRLHNDLPDMYRGLVTFSIGVVTCLSCSITAEDLVEMADNLMYEVKKSGKNNVLYREIS